MKNRKNNGQANPKKQQLPWVLIFLTIAIVLSLVLLGLYVWKNRAEDDRQKRGFTFSDCSEYNHTFT